MPPSPADATANSAADEGHAWPLLVAALAAACFASMDGCIKLLAPRYDAFQLAFFRFAAGSVFALLLWAWRRSPLPPRSAWRLHLLRSALLLVSIVGYFHALTLLPLALALTISYLAPIFVAVLAAPLLRERPAPAVWLALGAGLAGVSITVLPELTRGIGNVDAARLGGIASAAFAAISFAGVMLLARRQAQSDPVFTILLVQSVLPLLLLALPAAWTWRPLQSGDLALIALAGAFGTCGLLCLTWAFTRLEASRVASLEYSGFVWAATLGYLLFGEVPSATTAASAALIIGGCLLLLRR